MSLGVRFGAAVVASFLLLSLFAAAAGAETMIYRAPEAPKVAALQETPSLAPIVNAGQLPAIG
ncbi:MAG TPA: hypothetical protein EYP07_15790, partial [Kiloniellaceae bacterium]|nr:hypothetical protein [Kiloniellaceae bacterium]